MSSVGTPSSSVGSPSSSFASEQHVKDNNIVYEENKDNQLALILLIVGICVPCIWFLNWIMHRKSLNSKARLYAKISGILQLIVIGIVVIGAILFFAGGFIFPKTAIPSDSNGQSP